MPASITILPFSAAAYSWPICGIDEYGTPRKTTSAKAIASFGVPARAAHSADELEAAVTAALAAEGPTVIEAVVDSEHYVDTVYD